MPPPNKKPRTDGQPRENSGQWGFRAPGGPAENQGAPAEEPNQQDASVMDTLQVHVVDAKSSIDALQTAQNNSAAENVALKTALTNSVAELASMQTALTNSTAELASLQIAHTALAAQVATIQTAQINSRTQTAGLRQEFDALSRQLLCVSCFENAIQVRYEPCGHKMVCTRCHLLLWKPANFRCLTCNLLVATSVTDYTP
jgi:hypothetical protein